MQNSMRGCLAVAAIASAAILGSGEPARAAVTTSGCAAVNSYCTLQELQNPSSFIAIDGVFFNNFSSLFFPADQIKVTPIDQPGKRSPVALQFEPVNPNSNPWVVEDLTGLGVSLDAYIKYDANVQANANISGSRSETEFVVDVSGGFYNSLFSTKDITAAANAFGGPFSPVSLQVDCADFPLGDCDGQTGSDAQSFTQLDSFTVEDSISGSAQQVFAGTAKIGVSQHTNTFRRVPVPATLTLLIVALAGLGLAGRARRLG